MSKVLNVSLEIKSRQRTSDMKEKINSKTMIVILIQEFCRTVIKSHCLQLKAELSLVALKLNSLFLMT